MRIVCVALTLFIYAMFVRIVLSWFSPQPGGPVAAIEGFLRTVTDPVLEPVRRIVPRTGMIDLSPIVVLVVIWAIQGVVC